MRDSCAWRWWLWQSDDGRSQRAPLQITYTYGLSTNAVLQRATEELLAEAVRLWDETQTPQRLFAGFWYQAGSWPVSRLVVVKAEANMARDESPFRGDESRGEHRGIWKRPMTSTS